MYFTDVDECLTDTHKCAAGAVCANTIGAYTWAGTSALPHPCQPNSEPDYIKISTTHASISNLISAISSPQPNTHELLSTGVLSQTMREITRSTTSNDRFPDTSLVGDPSTSSSVTTRSRNVDESAGAEPDGAGPDDTSKETTVIVSCIISIGFILLVLTVLGIYVKYRKRRLPDASDDATRQNYASSCRRRVKNNGKSAADSRASIPLKEDKVQA